MSKTKEELKALKEEVEAVNEKLQELTEEEIAQVNGGAEADKCANWSEGPITWPRRLPSQKPKHIAK